MDNIQYRRIDNSVEKIINSVTRNTAWIFRRKQKISWRHQHQGGCLDWSLWLKKKKYIKSLVFRGMYKKISRKKFSKLIDFRERIFARQKRRTKIDFILNYLNKEKTFDIIYSFKFICLKINEILMWYPRCFEKSEINQRVYYYENSQHVNVIINM